MFSPKTLFIACWVQEQDSKILIKCYLNPLSYFFVPSVLDNSWYHGQERGILLNVEEPTQRSMWSDERYKPLCLYLLLLCYHVITFRQHRVY